MPKILKRLPSSIVQASTILPRADLGPIGQREAYRIGAIYGASSVIALDYAPKKLPAHEPKGLRDDWLALGSDFKVVTQRIRREVERDELAQRSLLEHGLPN